MTHKTRISEPASMELAEAVRWYETQREGLGAELFDAVSAAIERIEEQAEIGAAAYPDPQNRRLVIDRFPYQIVYRIEGHEILVLAIAHLRRRPGYWKDRN